MPTSRNPMAADFNGDRITIQMQCGHGRSADRCDPDDSQSVLAPAKVLDPVLSARIEQRLLCLRDGVHGERLIRFMSVTNWATEPEVFFVVAATLRTWLEVFDLKRNEDQMLRTQTIATAMLGGVSQSAFNVGGQASPAHVSPSWFAVRERPRSARRAPSATIPAGI